MTKNEIISVLSLYKYSFNRSQAMMNKIKTLETSIYSAQAGFVENESGVMVSGGNHITRAEKISELTDLKDGYYSFYTECENICFNINSLISNIYTNNVEVKEKKITKVGYIIKLQQYETILINHYVNNMTMSKISEMMSIELRYLKRLKNNAIDIMTQMYQSEDYSKMIEKMKSKSSVTDDIKPSSIAILEKNYNTIN